MRIYINIDKILLNWKVKMMNYKLLLTEQRCLYRHRLGQYYFFHCKTLFFFHCKILKSYNASTYNQPYKVSSLFLIRLEIISERKFEYLWKWFKSSTFHLNCLFYLLLLCVKHWQLLLFQCLAKREWRGENVSQLSENFVFSLTWQKSRQKKVK